jgi:hypothetical protein
LYYPEWTINDPLFLAECLLFWDRIACMVPYAEFEERPWHPDDEMRKLMAEAHERFVFRFVPTDAQKHEAHQAIAVFAEQGAPDWCRPEYLKAQQRQIFSAYKFAPETVELLRDKGWTKQFPSPNNLELQLIADAAADLVLGALAQACSSETMPPVTDDPGSFAANCNLVLRELGAATGITTDAQKSRQAAMSDASQYAFLMTHIPHLGIPPDDFSPDRLRVILASREKPDIDGRRKAFQRKVDECVVKLRGAQDQEREMIAEQLGRDLASDLELLKRDLRQAGLEALVSKEGIIAIVLGLATGAVHPGLGIAIGLVGGAVSYHQKRQAALDRHWSSWILATSASRFALW